MGNVNVNDETGRLKMVILGIGTSTGPARGINAKARVAIRSGTYPDERALVRDLRGVASALSAAGVKVLRPRNVANVNQVFTRDIGFVVGHVFVRARMKVAARAAEYEGITDIIDKTQATVVIPPKSVTIEGGDVVLHRDVIFVGQGGRTNKTAISFLRELFPRHRVVPLSLNFRSRDPLVSALHLDCVFQPVGSDNALIFRSGFADVPKPIYDLFPKDRRIMLRDDDLRDLRCNVVSVSPKHVLSVDTFVELNDELRRRGLQVTTVPYANVSILGGLLRCSTLPLWRD